MAEFNIHELKTDPEPYNDIDHGLRSCTIRVDDRGFKEGDYILLRKTKYTGVQMASKMTGGDYPLVYTGSALFCKITHIHSGVGMATGYVCVSFNIVDRYPGRVM